MIAIPARSRRPLCAAARWRWAAALASALVLGLVAACAGNSDAATGEANARAAPPSDIREILVGEPTVVDVGARSATVLAKTTIDVVCAVSYGPTTAYGQIATDSDMAGGGHANHRPLLRGLQPDTLYHYQLSGTGPDGTLYRSEDFTFRTPPAAAEASELRTPAGENLILGKVRVAGVSSNFGGGGNDGAWGANNAIDGDPGTQWSSDGDGDGAWIEIELAAESRVTSVGFWTRTMGDSAQILSFRVVSDRGDVAGPFTLADAGSIYYFDTDMTARRLRFESVSTSGGNTGALEIEVYGAAVQ